jgi:hypothetical protein
MFLRAVDDIWPLVWRILIFFFINNIICLIPLNRKIDAALKEISIETYCR